MKKSYFDIQAPENNVVYDYNWKETASNKDKQQKRLKPSELYKIIPFAFSVLSGDQSASTLREGVRDLLKDKNNLSYLAVRCTYSENYKSQYIVNYPNNRNNVLNALMSLTPGDITKEDLGLIKDVFKKAIEQGVSPLEKSMNQGYTPLAYFLSYNHFFEQELDFLKFLIELHPDSLTDFSEKKDRKPIIHLLFRDDYPIGEERATEVAQLMELIVAYLPSRALKSTFSFLQKFNNNCKQLEIKERFDPILQHLAVKIEKDKLEKNITPLPSLTQEGKLDSSSKKSFKI